MNTITNTTRTVTEKNKEQTSVPNLLKGFCFGISEKNEKREKNTPEK